MTSVRCLLLCAFLTVFAPYNVHAQQLIGTIPVQNQPWATAVNFATNQIYVTNSDSGTVSVIDGVTGATTTIGVDNLPLDLAVNSVTNKIYVVNNCGGTPYCGGGTVSVIDGASGTATSVVVGVDPLPVVVNPTTNRIYVANYCGQDQTCHTYNGSVTVIDGATNNIIATVNVGGGPYALAVNKVTNQIYVANQCGNDSSCQTYSGTVTIIDGASNNTTNINVGAQPSALAVNELTNQIYVANECGSDSTCRSSNSTVTVIDGNTGETTTVATGKQTNGLAGNQISNKIYASNYADSSVTVIDGATLATTTVDIGSFPISLAADPASNKIYTSNSRAGDGTVTMIDGSTNATVTITVGRNPQGIAVNPTTNRAYTANYQDNTVSVIGGASSDAVQFIPVMPCRLVDTRNSGNPIVGGTSQSFILPQLGGCNIPDSAAAYSLNVTAVPQGSLGYLTIWPTGEDQPVVSTMNSLDGRIKANAAIVPVGYQGAVSVFATNTTNLVLDIDGYFAPISDSTLAFYPLAPCRVLDTRNGNGDLGGPYLQGKNSRSFPILEATSCNIPSSAQAYSLNFTAIPLNGGALGYLTVWPTGQSRPVVSTLNDLTGTVVANAAIVPAGTGGAISAYASNDTNLAADINGYFAPAGTGGLSLYTGAPCRVIDTRKIGNGQPFSGALTPPVDVVDSACGIPAAAQAYVFNATTVPNGPLYYLTLWPDGEGQPLVSTLNALDGAITSNMAIVPTTNGKVDAYASGSTQLVLDISSYFAP